MALFSDWNHPVAGSAGNGIIVRPVSAEYSTAYRFDSLPRVSDGQNNRPML
jgi:hypothetical protein